MNLVEYFEIGIFFACLSIFFGLITRKYFFPTAKKTFLKEIVKDDKLMDLTAAVYTNVQLQIYGQMFAWFICWPAMLVFKVITIIVWFIKAVIWIVKTLLQ